MLRALATIKGSASKRSPAPAITITRGKHMNIIKSIFGIEPQRDGEYPLMYTVGDFDRGIGATVTRIDRETENFGDHGVLWFHIYAGDELVSTVQGRAIAQVIYSREARAA